MLTVPQAGADDAVSPAYVPRSHVTRIIRPRGRGDAGAPARPPPPPDSGRLLNRGVVLTGGASQLNGLIPLSRASSPATSASGAGRGQGMPESANSRFRGASRPYSSTAGGGGLEFLGASRGGLQAASRWAATSPALGGGLRDSF